MSRGRPAHTDPPIRIHCNVPESVIGRVDLALVDPVRGRTTYGARSKLINKLLTDWLKLVEQGKVDVRSYTGGF